MTEQEEALEIATGILSSPDNDGLNICILARQFIRTLDEIKALQKDVQTILHVSGMHPSQGVRTEQVKS